MTSVTTKSHKEIATEVLAEVRKQIKPRPFIDKIPELTPDVMFEIYQKEKNFDQVNAVLLHGFKVKLARNAVERAMKLLDDKIVYPGETLSLATGKFGLGNCEEVSTLASMLFAQQGVKTYRIGMHVEKNTNVNHRLVLVEPDLKEYGEVLDSEPNAFKVLAKLKTGMVFDAYLDTFCNTTELNSTSPIHAYLETHKIDYISGAYDDIYFYGSDLADLMKEVALVYKKASTFFKHQAVKSAEEFFKKTRTITNKEEAQKYIAEALIHLEKLMTS